MRKPKREKAGSFSKNELEKLYRLYTQGIAAYGSLRNLVKTSSLPVSKLRHFLHSKPSYKKFLLATRKLKRMKALSKFQNEIWRVNLAHVDKLAKDNNGVKQIFVRQDLFDRTVYAKRMKTKDSKETVRPFLTLVAKKS